MQVKCGEPDAVRTSELIDGKHEVIYTDMGTLEQRLERLEAAMGQPPSAVLSSLMPDRHKEGQVSIQLACKPAGFYIDSAPTFEDAKVRARELIAYNDEHHRRKANGGH